MFFLDQYQLSSANFLLSKNLRALRAISGETDLEAPDWAVSLWGATMLLELAPPQSSESGWSAEIPLHLRYLSSNGLKVASDQSLIPWPAIFWACPAEEGTKMNTNPFDRMNLGYDGLFGPRTMFHHLQPFSNGSLVEAITVPVLKLDQVGYLANITTAVVFVGAMWICWVLLKSTQLNITRRLRPDHANKND